MSKDCLKKLRPLLQANLSLALVDKVYRLDGNEDLGTHVALVRVILPLYRRARCIQCLQMSRVLLDWEKGLNFPGLPTFCSEECRDKSEFKDHDSFFTQIREGKT